MTSNKHDAEHRTHDDEDLRLLDAARSVYAARGIKGTSTDDIARAAGVTRVTLYRRLGTREDIIRATFSYESKRWMSAIHERFTPFDSLEWNPVRHVEDLLVGTIYDVRDSDLVRRLLTAERVETMAMLASESEALLSCLTDVMAGIVRDTWDADVHSRAMTESEKHALSIEVGSIVGRIVHSLVTMPEGPPSLVDENEIRSLARTTLVPLILQR